MSIKDLPHVTVEQVLALRSAAIELEVENKQLEDKLAEVRQDSDDTESLYIENLKKDLTEKEKELEFLKYENAKLGSVMCQTCKGAGSVCRSPDDCYDCPECTTHINKIKADAICDVADDYVNGCINQELSVKYLYECANKLEAGE